MTRSTRTDLLMTTSYLAEHLDDPSLVVVEVDEDTTAFESGHIPGAVVLDWARELKRLPGHDFASADQLARVLAAKGLSDDQTIVFYGGSNNWFAAYVFWLCRYRGIGGVRLLDGGRSRWTAEGRPLTTEVVRRPPGRFRAAVDRPKRHVFRERALQDERGTAPTSYTVPKKADSVTSLTAATLDALRRRLSGPLLAPMDEGFANATRLWNGMIDKTPALVVQPNATADVVAAVSFARDHDLALSVRGGGHHIAGTALADGGLTIDMSRLREITVDPVGFTARVQPGCLLGEVDRATQEHGLAVPLGFISRVGVAGLTLGGGLGYLSRRFGWTVDSLLEIEIVTADGQVRRASRTTNPELFWAARGAGANLGVVTSFTFRLHEVGPIVHGGLIAWPFERADEILRAYRAITAQAPRELSVWMILMNAPPAPFVPRQWHGMKICAMAVCYTGGSDDADAALAPIRALADPIVDLIEEMPYTAVQSYLDDGQPAGMHYYWKTEYVAELSGDLLTTACDLFAECAIPGAEVGFLHLGGALNEHPDDDGAVGNRDARFAVGAFGMWEPGEPDAEKLRQWIRDAGTALRAFSTGGNYVNFQTADEGTERIRAMYGANYDRLAEIKRAYDPDNVFRSNRNILPAILIRTRSPGQ